MIEQPKSINDHIDCLARLTGAPGSFVLQVRELFTSKGISLDADAEPFLDALDEAFRREENIRANSSRARVQIEQLRDNFRKVGEVYVEQLSQLKKLRTNLRQQSGRQKRAPAKGDTTTTRVTIKGDHRSLVTPTVREQFPMVPGPEEPQ